MNKATTCTTGILVQGGSGIEASNNTCSNGVRGIEFNGTSASSVKYNTCLGNAQAGLYLYTSSTSTVLRNNASNNFGSGLVAILGTNNKVESNSFFGNGFAGLRATSDANLVINTNHLGGNGASGIRLDTCSYPTLFGNVLTNEANGVRISGGTGAIAYQNHIIGASGTGVSILSTTVVVMHDNLIEGCTGYAIEVTSTSGSRFNLNVFLNNNGTSTTPNPSKRQARDDTTTNEWSFQGKGNFWLDMISSDANRDGIVDSSYALAGKAIDSKPLSGPLGPVTGATFKKGKTYIDLKWSAPNYTAYAPLTQYFIERTNSSSTVTFTLPYTQTALNDTSIFSGSDYTYSIKARSSLGESVAVTLLVLKSAPPQVQVLTPVFGSQVNSTHIFVSWIGYDQDPGIARYEYRVDLGGWTYIGMNTNVTLSGLSQGTHGVTIKAVDLDGMEGFGSTTFFVDANAPTLVINVPVSGSILNQTSVLVRWTATDDGSGVKDYQIRLDLGPWMPRQAQNQSTIAISPGMHSIYVRAFDQVDLVRTSSITLTIDPYAPLVTITSPSKTYLSNESIHLAWTGAENITSIVSYEVSADSSTWILVGQSNSYDLTLGEGQHLLRVRAKDQASNYGNAQLSIFIDLVGPQVTIIRPINGAFVNQRNVVIQWNVTSNGSLLAYSEVSVDGAVPWINVGKSLTYTTPSLAEGPHSVGIRAWDEAGNSFLNSTTFIVDSISPIVTWTYPSYGKILNRDYVVMRWNMSDENSGLNTTFAIVDSLALLEIGLVNEHNVTNLSHGGHMIGVRVYDLAGNYHDVRVGITVDLVAPVLKITYPAEGQIIQARDINVMWTASDNGSGLSHFYGKYDNSNYVDFQLAYSHVFTGFTDGRHVVYIGAIDNAQNRYVATVNFTVDFSLPAVSIQYPTTGGWTNSTDFVARWTGSDTPLGMNHYEVRLDGSNWTNVGLNTTYRFSGLNSSSHVIEVKGVSNSTQETIAKSTFGIDLLAPSMPTVVQPPLYVGTGRISFSWGAASDNLSGIGGYQVRTLRTYFNGSAYVTDTGSWVDTGTSLSYTSTGNQDGWYNVSVRAKDKAGNTGLEDTIQLTLDSRPPRALSYSPVGTTVVITPIIEVAFSEEMVRSTVVVHFAVSGTVAWDGNTSLLFIPNGALLYNRNYTVRVEGRDLAGNAMTSLIWAFKTEPNVGVLTGRVVNEISAPIPGALVSLENGQSAVTNNNGVFSITAPSGNHTMTISYGGYSKFQVNITLSAGDITDIGLTPMSKAGTDYKWVIILTFVLLVAVAIELIYLRRKRKP
jgi:parallel beta-helix repeat protein